MRRFLRLAIPLVVCCSPSTAASAQEGPWTQLANADLEEMRRLIVANHPGPVDPENPNFREWLEDGLKQAQQRAASAKTFSDYKRVLRFYSNGFADGHLSVGFPVDARWQLWPGFVPTIEKDGSFAVGISQEENVPAGAKLLSCDGIAPRRLAEERVFPYWWNREIPHEKLWLATRLLVIDPTDQSHRLKSCDIELESVKRTVTLEWRRVRAEDVTALREEAVGWVTPQLGLKQINDVWFASIPKFLYQTDEEVAEFRAFLADLASRSNEIRSGTLVLDLRGGFGGNSAWGDEVATAIWGAEWVERIKKGFDYTVDWRISPDNIQRNRSAVDELAADGLAEMAEEYRRLSAAMEAAQLAGRELLRVGSRPEPTPANAPRNPVRGKVFLLTDMRCFSACLDFVDIVRRMPGVRHIGQPTAADTVYMENIPGAVLPSGLATFSYSLKVTRNRVRGHNEWYDPHVLWPGGPMTDQAVSQWVSTLR